MGSKGQRVIGIEGGGTKSEWVYLGIDGHTVQPLESGSLSAANWKLIPPSDLKRLLRSLPRDATHAGVFLAGCGTRKDREELHELVRSVWPAAKTTVGSDRDSGFHAAFGNEDGIIVIAGTGSAVEGRRGGRIEKAGGWGQLLGDRGGGFDIGLHGLRHCLRIYDVEQRTIPLAAAFLRELGLNNLRDLVDWGQEADKLSIANLTPILFELARENDPDILLILQVCARRLAEYTWAVATRLEFDAPPIGLRGGVFLHNPAYVEMFEESLAKRLPEAQVRVSAASGALAAARLVASDQISLQTTEAVLSPPENGDLATATTEQLHPSSENLDELGTADLVDLFLSEEATVTSALESCRIELQSAIDLVHGRLSRNGRMFYAGAGTSGRLGVLDASEIPPTFGAPPNLVQGIIAGGPQALQSSIEGAEDSANSGAMAINDRAITAKDVVCGITASGRTPFVLGALDRARKIGAATLLLTCNPNRTRQDPPWDIEIDLPTGPELIAGSTRLKAGTATKLALNILSTCTMIRLGKVKGNLMIDLHASNAKLRNRAARMLSLLKGCSYNEAWRLLAAHNWKVRDCLAQDPDRD